jgi:hypothetical protein
MTSGYRLQAAAFSNPRMSLKVGSVSNTNEPEMAGGRGAGRLFSAANWLVYWIIGRLHPFLLRLFCYAYITVACILQVIYRREPKNLWNHHYGLIISA